MRTLLATLVFIVSTNALAFTLASPTRTGFPHHEITIDSTSNECENTGLSEDDILDLAYESAEMFWNKVSTSRLELKKGEQRNIDISGDTTTLEVANRSRDNHILVGCNANMQGFDDGFIGAVGGFACYSNGNCRGFVIINNHPDSNLDTYSRAELLALMGHEIGHAVGLGHSSVQEALMHYSLSGKTQEFLHQDDIRGISYLYPQEKKLGGLMGACGSISLINNRQDPPSSGGLFLGLSLLFLFSFLTLEKLKRSNIAKPQYSL